MVYSYAAYGLGIRSEILLKGLPDLNNIKIDVEIRLGKVDPFSIDALEIGENYRANLNEVCLSFENIGNFLVRRGCEIIIDPALDADKRLLQFHLFTSVMSSLFVQRGSLVLHCSGVVMDGEAILFLGESGSGKSTIASAFYANGNGLITDDIIFIDFNKSHPKVSGTPILKLFPESIYAMGMSYDPKSLFAFSPEEEKRCIYAKSIYSWRLLPLGRIYFLMDDSANSIEHVDPQEAFVGLVRSTVGPKPLLKKLGISHINQYACLVNQVEFRRMRISRNIENLPDIVRMVETDIIHK